MTDFDKKLIAKAEELDHWEYRKIDTLIQIADTKEAKDILNDIYYLLRDCTRDISN